MHRLLRVFLLSTSLAMLACGCTGGGYMQSRGRDAADILTLTIGTGFGVKARIGPLQPAILMNHDMIGLRAGEGVYSELDEEHNWEMYLPLPLSDDRSTCGTGYYHPREVSEFRGKAIREISPCPLIVVPDPERRDREHVSAQWTQIEVAGGAILTVRVGLNLGEFVDFLLGWFGVDLYHDDF